MTDGASSAISSAPAPQPSPRIALLLTVLAALLAYGICLQLRLLEAPAWNTELFQVHGEPLMATHDAYYFLAGAQGTGRPHPDHEPFFKLTRFFQAVTGMSLNQLGFWAPIFLAPLVVFPLAFLAWREGVPEAVLPMGILAAGTMGFLSRTRLGYYDHDMLSLLLPVLLGAGLLVFLDNWLRRPAPAQGQGPDESIPVAWMLGFCLGLGLLGLGYLAFYASGRPILTAMLVLAGLLGLASARSGLQRCLVLIGVGAIFLLAVNWAWGLALMAGLALVLGPLRPWLRSTWALWGVAGTGLAAVVFGGNLDAQVAEVFRQLGKYAAFAPEGNQTAGELHWPSVMQSVREARLLSPFFMAERSGATWWLFAAGVVGYVYLCVRRPLYLIFLPFLALSIGAIKLGARFTMYGGVPAGLGLGLGVALLLQNLGLRRRVGAIVLSAFGLVAAGLLWAQAGGLQPRPIMSKVYAQTLQDLREVAAEDARVWLWWDYGYATQYYARRASFGDGTLNSHAYLFPMALVHTTDSPLQAAQMIKLVTAGQLERWHQAGSPQPDQGRIPWPLYLQPPLAGWRDIRAEDAQAMLDSLAEVRRAWPEDLPEQFLLLSWDNLNLSHWITTFGNWDLATGQGVGGRLQRVPAKLDVDLDAGTIVQAEGEAIPMDGFFLVAEEPREFLWENDSGRFAVYVDDLQLFLLMDRVLYRSMLVRMLLADPEEFAEHFELVTDRSPWIRVYRVR